MRLIHLTLCLGLLLGGINASAQDMLITAIYDGPLSGGTPKGIELYVVNDIPDLSIYGIGSATNGGASNGVDYTLPADAATAGSYIYIVSSSATFPAFFGTTATYVTGTAAINGDDVIELFLNGVAFDVYGVVGVDGTGQPWDYEDSWAYRVSGTAASTTWNPASWTVAGSNVYDGTTTNAAANPSMPIGTYTAAAGTPGCTDANACNYDSNATVNDGSCFSIGDACDDSDANTVNDVIQSNCSCLGETSIPGCTDANACNYDNTATVDNGSCDYSCIGCTNALACNYDSNATTDSGLCAFIGDSCDDNDPLTAGDVYQGDCSCAGVVNVPGCTNNTACNYNSNATTDDGSCDFSCLGCTNSAACNYNLAATIDNGTCILIGDACDDSNAFTVNDIIQANCSCAGELQTPTSSLIITAVYDGPLSGGIPKGVELYTLAAIADLSTFGIGSANNGGGTDGQEFTFPAISLPAGTFFFVSSDEPGAPAFFESTALNINASSVMGINGDDAIELYEFGQVIDTFGDINASGTGTAWEYLDGWAVRNCATDASGTTFDANNWTFSGINVFDGVTTVNSAASLPMPIGAYLESCPSVIFGCTNSLACNYNIAATDDDGSCILIGDACDDGNIFTENDITGSDCSCAGTAIVLCNPVVWTAVDVTLSSGSTGGSFVENAGSYNANGYCGVGCIQPVETWLVSNGYDFSAATTSSMLITLSESFGVTDLELLYTTEFDGVPANSIWYPLAVFTASGQTNFDLSEIIGEPGIYFGFRYADDGADGYSSWTISQAAIAGDCPSNITIYDCPALLANFGAPCNDNDPLTINDMIQTDCTCAGETFTQTNALVITAIFDGPLGGGLPKGIEVYAKQDIPDLSIFGVGSASNGGGSGGLEYSFPADAVTAGTFFFVTSDETGVLTFFESTNTNYNAGNVMSINGDDAIELFENGFVIDVVGDVNVDGTGTAWDHLDGFGVRNCGTGPDGGTFVQENWTFSGINALDDALPLNVNGTTPMPVAAYQITCELGCTDINACNYSATATADDNSCILPVANCSVCNATNDGLDIVDSDSDGICDADEVAGCTSLTACNYDSSATDDNGSCLEPVANCSECSGQTLIIIDTDGDGICDAEDGPVCDEDINHDGVVDVNDFLRLIAVFGSVCE
ncbi:MAG: hypothetical protein GC193_00605 [Cryomorphaceae bacterium]|nr:hypothetical protein [Cryomorphaceae bacterium]